MRNESFPVSLQSWLYAAILFVPISAKASSSSGDISIQNNTDIPMNLQVVSAVTSSNANAYYSSKNTFFQSIVDPRSTKDVFTLVDPIEQTISFSFSYRDPDSKYGRDFKYILSYIGSNPGSDQYYNNFYATPVYALDGTHVNCIHESGYQETVTPTTNGVNISVFFSI